MHLPRPHPEVQIASVIALVDFTADNGATRVVPGSHRWSPDRGAAPDELEAAEMAAGSAVVYLGSTLHGGGPNSTTDVRRRGMHVSYCVGWLRTEENQYLATPIDVVRSLPRESQALLGYAAHDASPPVAATSAPSASRTRWSSSQPASSRGTMASWA